MRYTRANGLKKGGILAIFVSVFLIIVFPIVGIPVAIIFIPLGFWLYHKGKQIEQKQPQKFTYVNQPNVIDPNKGKYKECPDCHTMNLEKYNYCKICGLPLYQECPKCKRKLDVRAKHCGHCGEKL